MTLAPEVTAIGNLIGLLTGSDDDPSLNTAWFSDPVGGLEGIGGRLGALATLVDGLIGPASPASPPVFEGAAWYPLPNPILANAPLAVCLVAPADGAAQGEFGAGVLVPQQLGAVTVTAYAYVPLFGYDASGATFLADQAGHPVRIGLSATASTDTPFTADGITFASMDAEAEITLASLTSSPPTFSLTFGGLSGGSGSTTPPNPGPYTTLEELLDPTVSGWMNAVVNAAYTWLRMYAGNTTVTMGDLMVKSGYMTGDITSGYQLDLSQLEGKSAGDIALGLGFAVLDTLSAIEFPIVDLPGGGIYVENDSETGDYGVRVAAVLSLDGGSTSGTGSGSSSSSPLVDVCVGAWFSGEDDSTSWMARTTGSTDAHAGITLYLLNRAQDGTLSFAPSFSLVSAGFNLRGAAGAPLVNEQGVVLAGAEVRGYLDQTGWKYGFGAKLDGVGFPLGPSFTSAQQGGAGDNVVAQNLIATGSDSNASGQTSAVNPAFSAEAAYVEGSPPLFEIFDASGAQTDVLWFPIQSRFGPVTVQKVGVKLTSPESDPVLGILVDGDVALAGLDVYLDELSVSVPLEHAAEPDQYSLDLQGLDVTFSGGGIEISGGLLKVTDADGTIEYDGEAILKAEELAISALGSYAALEGGGTSLFIFAMLNAPIGGPGFFFVTGLSAGLGYNRSLKIPAQSQVQDFPLVAGLSNPALIGGSNPSPAQVLASLADWVPIARGEYWLAAGVQFTTYDVINSNVLLTVQFGADFVIAVLGVSTLKQPQVGETYVYAELGIEAVLRPSSGEFQASAVLAPSSFVLDPQCHLTGGFAFYTWFGGNAHSGDFAFTIGGYHPAFDPPSWYPAEPRVGVSWQFDSHIALSGDAYFAITPTAMMAGAALQVTYSDGALKAWLKANTDVIVFWKPFYLVAEVSVSVGASYHISVVGVNKTLSVELGCDFLFWGPPVGFKVHVDWYVISFTIGSGEPDPPTTLSWSDFKGMLPSKTTQSSSDPAPAPGPTAMAASAPADSTTTTPAYLYINAAAGLLSTQVVDGITLWLVRAAQFQVTVGSALPALTIVIESEDASGNQTITGTPVGIRGVNGGIDASDYQSTQTITLLAFPEDSSVGLTTEIQGCLATSGSGCTNHPAGCTATTADTTGWVATALVQNIPQAMWGAPVPAGQTPDINPSTPTVTATMGVTLAAGDPVITNCTPEMVIDQVFADRVINPGDEYRLSLSPSAVPCPDTPKSADSFTDLASVNDADLSTARASLFSALLSLGVTGWTNDPLPLMAANPGHDFADEPMEGDPVCAGTSA